MQTTIDIDTTVGLIVQRISGVMTADAVAAVYEQALTHPHWSPHFDHLVIYESVSLSQMTPGEVERMVAHFVALDTKHRGNIPSKAATVMDDELQEALLALYEALSNPELVTEEKIFANEARARAWLASGEE